MGRQMRLPYSDWVKETVVEMYRQELSSHPDRARIDHTNLPYDKNLVLLMCRPCNMKHDLYNGRGDKISGGFIILFKEVY